MKIRLFAVALALAISVGWHSAAAAEFDPSDNYVVKYYTASADQDLFSVPWAFEADDDLIVMVSADAMVSWETLTLTTDYTVSGEGSTGGSVLLGTALNAGDVVLIARDDAIFRTDDFGATISPGALNQNFDRQTVWLQDVENVLQRQALKLPITDYEKDVTLPPMTSSVARHAVTVARTYDDFDYSAKSLDDWACLTCPPATCTGGENDGDPCGGDADCPDGVCTTGFENCEYIGTDADGELVCNSGICPSACDGNGGGGGGGYCLGGTNDGDPCTDDADCAGGGTCEPGTGCLQCGPQGVCDGGTNDGGRCTVDTDCPEGTCSFAGDGVCFGGAGDGDACTDDADCPEGGTCRPSNDVCRGGDTDSESCTTDSDCTGTCTGLVCADASSCATNADCDGICVDPRDVCEGGDNDGEVCVLDGDCPGGFCVACRTCFGGGSADQVCTADYDCPSGICMACDEGEACVGGTGDGDACTDDADCPGGGVCGFNGDGVGVLGPPLSTDGAFARWDGTTGKFLDDSPLRMLTFGLLGGPTGYTFRGRGQTPATAEQIILSYPWTATDATAREKASAWYNLPLNSTYNVATGKPTGAQYGFVAGQAASPGSGAQTQTYWSASTYPVTAFQPGVSTDGQLVARIYFTEPVICPDDWAGSYVRAGTGFTSNATYNFQKNGSTVGTAIWTVATSATVSALATSGGLTSYAAGDYLDIDGPATADGTGADLSFSLLCYRAISDEVAQ